MACDPATLLSQVSAFQGMPMAQLGLIEVAAYCSIVGGCDIQQLLSSASAFQGLPGGQLSLIEATLLCLISTGTTP